MGQFVVRESWLPVIKRQEQGLIFDSFGHEDALAIGLRIIEFARNKYKKAVAVSIEIDNNTIFSYMMQGTVLENKLWMFRKANVSKATQTSSLYTCVEIEYGLREAQWQDRQDAFVVCGGCWPVLVKNCEPFVYVAVSGLEHYLDHQIIVDALSNFSGKKVESVIL